MKIWLSTGLTVFAIGTGILVAPGTAMAGLIETKNVWVVNAKSGKCAVPPGADTEAVLAQYTCTSSASWYIWTRYKYYYSSTGTYYRFKNKSTSECMTGSQGSGDGVVFSYRCTSGLEQQMWTLHYNSTGYFKIRNVQSRGCMAIQGGSTSNGAKVITWPCGAWEDHYWRFVAR
ncbi:MAG: RICIN domain-containing protein [Micromonosporaceae bacterium]